MARTWRPLAWFARRVLEPVLLGGVIFAIWQAALQEPLKLPLAPALASSALLVVLFWTWNFHPGRPSRLRQIARFRLHPLGPALPWIAAAAITNGVHVLSLAIAETAIRPRSNAQSRFIEALSARPGGELLVLLSVVLMGPVLEEFFFRGMIQRPLERALGAPFAIGIAAFLFASMHGMPPFQTSQFVFGLAAGYAVYATSSIWAGVLLHVTQNATLILVTDLHRWHLLSFPAYGSGRILWPAWIISAAAEVLLVLLLVRAHRATRAFRGARAPSRSVPVPPAARATTAAGQS